MDEIGKPEKQRKQRERGVFEKEPGSGEWWVRYVDESGRLHREKAGTKSLAKKLYAKRKTEIQERRFFPERIRRRDQLLSKVIDDYLVRVKDTLRTYRDYERQGEAWKKALAGKSMRQIMPGDVDRYKAKRIREVSPASVNRELAFLKHIFNVAIADGNAETNPVRAVKLFRENNKRVRFLSEEEENELRKALGDVEWPLAAFAIHTGLRQSEQFRLRWENVGFNTGIITVPRSKHGESRTVPMNDTVREILRNLPSRMKSEFVFPSATNDTPMDARNYMRRVFMVALKDAKIEGLRWHDLRHTFASRLVMAGVDLRTVQELMGHKTTAMTLRYSHLSPAHQLQAVQRLSAARTDTTTDTTERVTEDSGEKGRKVVVLAKEFGAPSETRTPDPLIKSRGTWYFLIRSETFRDDKSLGYA